MCWENTKNKADGDSAAEKVSPQTLALALIYFVCFASSTAPRSTDLLQRYDLRTCVIPGRRRCFTATYGPEILNQEANVKKNRLRPVISIDSEDIKGVLLRHRPPSKKTRGRCRSVHVSCAGKAAASSHNNLPHSLFIFCSSFLFFLWRNSPTTA